jgi:hypothetical protein
MKNIENCPFKILAEMVEDLGPELYRRAGWKALWVKSKKRRFKSTTDYGRRFDSINWKPNGKPKPFAHSSFIMRRGEIAA